MLLRLPAGAAWPQEGQLFARSRRLSSAPKQSERNRAGWRPMETSHPPLINSAASGGRCLPGSKAHQVFQDEGE